MRIEIVFEPEMSGRSLEIPWASAEPGSGYFDLRENPGSLDQLEPARRSRPLRNFLAVVNSADSVFSTARAKIWQAEHEPASTPDSCEFSSRVELAFASGPFNLDRTHYDDLCRRLQELLTREAAADTLHAELRVSPCRFRALGRVGFCLRILLSARGATPEQAELRWGLGLARVQQALLFCSRILRQHAAQTS